MKYAKLAVVAVIIIGAGAGLAVWHGHSTKPKPTDALTTIRVAMDWTPDTNHTGLYVAQAKGWYKAQGLKLVMLPYSANVTASSLVLSGKADVGIGTTEDVVGDNARGDKLVSIGAITTHNTSGFIVRADTGIDSPKDLDGKTYGGYGSPFETPVVNEVIKKDGGQGDFKNVTLNVEAMQALESKKIDFVWAFAGWEVIEAQHDHVATKFFPITSYGIPDGPNLSFVATPGAIKDHQDTLRHFMTATAQGYEYARQQPHASAQMLIDNTPKGTFADPSLVFDSQQYLSAHYADKNHQWGVQDAAAWQGYPQFMLDSGVINDAAGKPVSSLDFSKLFTNQFVK